MKYICTISLLICLYTGVQAQFNFGEVRGKVVRIDKDKNQVPAENVNVVLYKNDTFTEKGASTNIQGNYIIKTVAPGEYMVIASHQIYGKDTFNITVTAGGIASADFYLYGGVVKLKYVKVRCKSAAITNTSNTPTISSKTFVQTGFRSGVGMSQYQAGANSTTSGISFGGSRADGTPVYIDGVKIANASPASDEYSRYTQATYKNVKSDPLSTFSIDVDRASYSIVRSYLNNSALPPPDAVRLEEMINYFNYEIGEVKEGQPFAIKTEICASPWNSHGSLMMLGLRTASVLKENLPPTHIVFLIDVSGSMEQNNKLPLVKETLKLLVKELREQDRISIVTYAGSSDIILENESGHNKQLITDAIDRLGAGGSTAGAEGINSAYRIAEKHFLKTGNNRVILATDGDFNVGVSSTDELEKLIEEKRKTNIYLSVLGFGYGNYKDNKMEVLADKGNGNYGYIDNLLEGKKMLVNEMGATLFTVAKDVKIQVEFNPAQVKSYRLLGYETRALQAEDFNNDRKDAGEAGAGHCIVALYELLDSNSTEKADVPSVDSLVFSKSVYTGDQNAMALVKIRYKEPQDSSSKLMTQFVKKSFGNIEEASGDMRLAASVASFGMLLRQDQYSKNIKIKDIRNWAKDGLDDDPDGYISEYLRMVSMYDVLKNKQ